MCRHCPETISRVRASTSLVGGSRCANFFRWKKNEKGFKERHWRKSDFSYYYEKMCFKLPEVCEGRAFIFDVRRDFRLKAIAIELSDVRTVGECRQRCLDESCPAATFESSTKTCRFYNQTRQESEGEEAPGVDYYENACRPERRRCENGRVDFIMAQHADVASFGIQAGTRSVRDCMRECIDSTAFHCRSLQYNPKTNECYISGF
ncbi:unnamed protein product, partial [Mesorhabditis spiculigera]